jgi:hypothetical protein
VSRLVGPRSTPYEVVKKLGGVFLFVYLAAIGAAGSRQRRGNDMVARTAIGLRSTALVALLAAGLLLVSVPAQASAPLRLTFEKQTVAPGVWEGTVSGDINGDLTTHLTACSGPSPCDGQIWHVEFDWIVAAGAESFTAHLSGTLNNKTGSVVMNGTVVDGFLQGAQVHEQGQLVDAATLRFEGTIQVMPPTA